MTCVAGLVYENKVWIGADSAGVMNYSLTPRKDPKVFINSNLIIGFTSSFRMGQLLKWNFTPPPVKEGQDVDSYMNKDFIDSVRSCFKHGGYAQKHNEQEHGGSFLVGFKGRLFSVDSDYQVGESLLSYDAVGCGADIALGALHATDQMNLTADQRIRKALEAAENFNAGVRSPFNVLSL